MLVDLQVVTLKNLSTGVLALVLEMLNQLKQHVVNGDELTVRRLAEAALTLHHNTTTETKDHISTDATLDWFLVNGYNSIANSTGDH